MKNITIKKIGLFGIILLLVIVASFFFCWQGLTPRTPSLNLVPATIEEAVHIVNIDKASSFEGELAAEGHVILGVETNENVVTVYSLSNYGQFGFENGIFCNTIKNLNLVAVILNQSKKCFLKNF